MTKTSGEKKILIILPRQLGDVLLGTPLATAIKRSNPDSIIDWCAHPSAVQILDGNFHLRKIYYYPVFQKYMSCVSHTQKILFISFFKRLVLKLIHFFKYMFDEIYFLYRLKKEKYDVVIDAMNTPRTCIQSVLTFSPCRISFKTNRLRNFCFHHLIDRELLNKGYLGHARLHLLEPLGIAYSSIDKKDLRPILPLEKQDKENVEAWMRVVSLKQNSFVVLSPTHRRPVRQWPKKSFIELGDLLIRHFDVSIVWFWGPGEKDFVNEIHLSLEERHHGKSFMPPLLSLRESGALAQLALGWVGNSNGLSHVAVSVGARTLEIHGPTLPESWCFPNFQRNQSVQRTEGCIQCSSNICLQRRRECLDDLKVDVVFEKIRGWIEKGVK